MTSERDDMKDTLQKFKDIFFKAEKENSEKLANVVNENEKMRGKIILFAAKEDQWRRDVNDLKERLHLERENKNQIDQSELIKLRQEKAEAKQFFQLWFKKFFGGQDLHKIFLTVVKSYGDYKKYFICFKTILTAIQT